MKFFFFKRKHFSTFLVVSNTFWGNAYNSMIWRSWWLPKSSLSQYQGKTVSDFKNYDPLADLAFTTAQLGWWKKVASKRLHFEEIFLLQLICWPTSNLFGPQVLYMDGKLLKGGIFWWIVKQNWSDYMVSRFSWRSPDRTVLYSWDLVIRLTKNYVSSVLW